VVTYPLNSPILCIACFRNSSRTCFSAVLRFHLRVTKRVVSNRQRFDGCARITTRAVQSCVGTFVYSLGVSIAHACSYAESGQTDRFVNANFARRVVDGRRGSGGFCSITITRFRSAWRDRSCRAVRINARHYTHI